MHGGIGDATSMRKTIESDRAQELICKNREKNEAIKQQIEEEISHVTILADKEETQTILEEEERKCRANR